MNASLMWLTAPADKTKRKNFDLHLSPGVRLAEGAVGQHYHASGNFSACKDKKRRGEGEEAWGRGVGGGCSWKTLRAPVILTGKEMTRKKKKKQENKRQLSDILRCYLLKRRSPQPPLPLLIIGCMLALRLNCAGFGSFHKVL